jgi:hypothetical protein
VKTRKLVFAVIMVLFLSSSLASSVLAEPSTPPPNAPSLTGAPVSGQQPQIPAVNQNQVPGQNNAPVVPAPVVPSTLPQSVDNVPVNVQPPDPSKGFDPTPLPITPPTPEMPTKETPIKNYQTSWYTAPWFLITLVLLLSILILVIYTLKSGKAPTEEKEEVTETKKRKRQHRNDK